MRIVQQEAGIVLLRFESVEDLVQGAYINALRSQQRFEWRSVPEFIGWLRTVLRRHLGDRRDYWFALKRNRGRILRLTWAEGSHDSTNHLGGFATTATGPATWAQRREQLTTVTRALEALPPRDRDLVVWSSEGVDIPELAARLDLSEDAARRARGRALERLRKIYTLLADPSPSAGKPA